MRFMLFELRRDQYALDVLLHVVVLLGNSMRRTAL